MFIKKILSLISSMALAWTFLTPQAFAITLNSGLSGAGTGAGYSSTTGITAVIGALISVFLGILGIVFLVLTIYAGFLWMTAAGDEKKVAKAKMILQSAVVGLVIILASYAISTYVITALQNATTGTAAF